MRDIHMNNARRRLSSPANILENPAPQAIYDAVYQVAPFDCAAVMSVDPETLLPSCGIFDGLDAKLCEPFWSCELRGPDVNRFADLASGTVPVASLAGALPRTFEYSARYREVYSTLPLGDELRVVFRSGRAVLGMAVFLRMGHGKRFAPEEQEAVFQLTAPATKLLRQQAFSQIIGTPPAGPVTLLLDESGEIIGSTPGSEDVLADLRDSAIGSGWIPPTILAPAALLQHSQKPTVSTLVRSASGFWYRLHLARLEGQTAGIAVNLEAARPVELMPVFLRAHGLTRREGEVVTALLRGLPTKQIAEELAISVHTANDHLKSIYQKAGVNSRSELLSRLAIGHAPGGHPKAPVLR